MRTHWNHSTANTRSDIIWWSLYQVPYGASRSTLVYILYDASYPFIMCPCLQIVSTLLYPVSLLIGGWDWLQGGNSIYAAVKCLSGRRGQIWQIFFFSFFFKKHISYPFPTWTFFGRIHKICLLPQIGHFFRGTDTFQELRAQAVRGARALLYQLLESARWQFCSKQSISWVSRTILWYYGR